MRRLLLASSSTTYGTGYLDHCERPMRALLAGARSVLFVPYALADRDRYASKAKKRFAEFGMEVHSIHEAPDPIGAVERADAIFVGGGNTFRLLKALYETGILEPIRRRVAEGIPYVGASAGSNVACPTIMTTNDMPIVRPPSFEALGLVPFQINPHYLDPDPRSTHMGETREERIREYLEENDRVVIGLREGAMIRVEGNRAVLLGTAGARVFRRGEKPLELLPGDSLDELLREEPARPPQR
jgi:dipeptidase E